GVSGGIDEDPGGVDEDSGGLKTDSGGLKTDSGGLKTDSGGLKTDSGGVKTVSGGLKTDSGGAEKDSGGVKTDSGGLKTATRGGDDLKISPKHPKRRVKPMAHQSFFPTTTDAQITWLQNFKVKIGDHAAVLGISPSAVLAIQADCNYLIWILGSWYPLLKADL